MDASPQGRHGLRRTREVHASVQEEVEALRKRVRELEEVEANKSEFLVTMGSELRTPLNGILGMTELVLETELTATQREHLQVVQASAESLLLVINNLLNLSKIEAGQFDLDPIAFNLRDSLGYTVGTLALQAHRNGLELVCHILSDVPDVLVGDPTVLRQVVVNLIDHAIKRSTRGILTLRVEVERQTANDVHLDVAIVSSGLDAPVQQAPWVFDALTRERNVSASAHGDSGINLLMTTRLVEMLGGRVWVGREGGKESAVHFTARFGLHKASVPRPVPADPFSVRGLPVLVMDDHPTNRRVLHEMLTSWSMKPVTVDSAPSALAALERAADAGTPFRLVVLDAGVREGDGFTLAEQVRRDPRFSRARMVMLTSTGRCGDAARCRTLGIGAYLTRPVRQSDLFDAIMTVLGMPNEGPAVLVTRHSLRENRRPLRLLLVEEHVLGQTLVRWILEKRGHTILVAGNGREALAALEQQPFDIVLVDLPSAEADIFRVTGAVRARQQTAGRPVRIIAMTAHPMEGDRQRDLERAVDDLLSKPFRAKALMDVVERLVPLHPVSPTKVPDSPQAHEPFDRAELMARVDDDGTLLRELIGLFLGDYPKRVSEIKDAMARRDLQALTRATHALHASLGIFCAKAADETVLKLETLSLAGDLSGAAEAFGVLDKELARLASSIGTLVNPGKPF